MASTDRLSDVLRAVRLTGGVFLDARFTADIAAPWSTDALAKAVALSRSAFTQRFSAVVGTPPIQYLIKWRLQTAQLNLRETRKSIAQVAHLVGYESEEAFSRAFKREFGVPPATWRDQVSAA